MAIRFTQFLYPDGRKQPQTFDASPEVEALALELQAAGWEFEIECHPRTSRVLADCCDSEEQLAQVTALNGPDVPGAIDGLVKRAWAEWVERGRPQAKNPNGGSRGASGSALKVQEQWERWAFGGDADAN